MTLTRDQLRAARMLLHLRQDTLAELSGVAIATIKRFETGSGIRPAQIGKLENALDVAGVVLIEGGEWAREDSGGDEVGKVSVGAGVTLKAEIPEKTLKRIAEGERREAERIEAERLKVERSRRSAKRSDGSTSPKRSRGRPRKRPAGGSEATGPIDVAD